MRCTASGAGAGAFGGAEGRGRGGRTAGRALLQLWAQSAGACAGDTLRARHGLDAPTAAARHRSAEGMRAEGGRRVGGGDRAASRALPICADP